LNCNGSSERVMAYGPHVWDSRHRCKNAHTFSITLGISKSRRGRNCKGHQAYLFSDESKIIDPAPALNALTVGSIARHDISFAASRFPNDVDQRAIARRDQPSPFSRSGPGPLGAIKPEVVEYGGNLSVSARLGVDRLNVGHGGLGEISTSFNFAQGRLFVMDCGTSFAAPKVANLAGLLLREYPNASGNLLRALIAANATVPQATLELFKDEPDKVLHVVGYGKVDRISTLFSDEKCVTLIAEEEISGDTHQFFEIPLPEDFFKHGRWQRELTVSLAHSPMVRRTRIKYKGSSMTFKIFKADSLNEVAHVFKWTKKGDAVTMLPEYGGFYPTAEVRSKGTVQAATGQFCQVVRRWGGKKLFVVVTHHIEPWADALVVNIKNQSAVPVRFYTQIREQLRVRGRVRL